MTVAFCGSYTHYSCGTVPDFHRASPTGKVFDQLIKINISEQCYLDIVKTHFLSVVEKNVIKKTLWPSRPIDCGK